MMNGEMMGSGSERQDQMQACNVRDIRERQVMGIGESRGTSTGRDWIELGTGRDVAIID